MDFAQNDTEQIKDLIQQQAGEGYKFITFLSEQAFLSIDDLSFFNNPYDALEFCYENSTDLDRYTCGTSESVLQLLEGQEQQNKIFNLKNNEMNKENFDYLKNQVKFTGFGDGLEGELKTNIERQEPTFQLKYAREFGKDNVNAILNFRRSDSNDMYYFNTYALSLKQPNKDAVTQTFYVGKDNTFTMKEGYNMLSGRAVNKDLVNKEGQGYNAWVQLDFKENTDSGNFKLKHFSENFGYDLDGALNKLPIKELTVPADKEKLTESLKKGNRQSSTFLIDGKEEKRFIEANPQFKTITVYDSSMKRIRLDRKEGETTSQSNGQETKKAQKQKDDDGERAVKATQKTNKKRGQKVS